MNETGRIIEEIVWDLTERLDPNTEPTALARFQSVLTALLLSSPTENLAYHPRRAAQVSDDAGLARLKAMRAAVRQGLAGLPELDPLPGAIAIWPVDDDAYPHKPISHGKESWFAEASAKQVFQLRDSAKKLGLFERAGAAQDGGKRVVSYFSDIALTVDTMRKPLIGWVLGLTGVLVLLAALAGARVTGNTLGRAYGVVSAAAVQYDDATSNMETWSKLRKSLNDECTPPDGKTEGPSLAGLCAGGALDVPIYLNCLAKLTGRAVDMKAGFTKPCLLVWEHALLDTETENASTDAASTDAASTGGVLAGLALELRNFMGYFGLHGADIAETRTLSLLSFYYAAGAGTILLIIGYGYGTKGRWSGLLIGPQKRLSLSLFQITAWTVVLLSAYAVFAFFNLGATPGYWNPWDETGVFELFPEMPFWTWAVLGISVAAPFMSTLIKGAEVPEGWVNARSALDTRSKVVPRKLSQNPSVLNASIGDLVFSEEAGKRGQVAITRVQELIISLILLFTYMSAMSAMLATPEPHMILAAFTNGDPIFIGVPTPGASFTALLALSHGAYLAGKLKPENEGSGADRSEDKQHDAK